MRVSSTQGYRCLFWMGFLFVKSDGKDSFPVQTHIWKSEVRKTCKCPTKDIYMSHKERKSEFTGENVRKIRRKLKKS